MARDIKKIDAKGRFILPSKLKEKFGNGLVVTISLDPGYLCAYTVEAFAKIEDQLRNMNTVDAVMRALQRAIIGEALEIVPDSQGRISITSELWDLIGAKAGDEICIVDFLDKLEICTKKHHDDHPVDIGALVNLDEKYYVEGL